MYPYANPYKHLSGTVELKAVRAAGFRERQFDTGSIRINYVVGPDNGPPLVLVPAQIGTWESYQRVLVPLSRRFRVYALDVRGHGKSSWTPGAYSWERLGADMTGFLGELVRAPAVISGNSSGGIIALWCAANLPDQVAGAILEDAPVFSAELPRFRDRDRFVYQGLQHLVQTLGDLRNRDLADYLRGQTLPVSETRERRVPDWFVTLLSGRIRAFQTRHPGPARRRLVLPADAAAAVQVAIDVRPGLRERVRRRPLLPGAGPCRGACAGAVPAAGPARRLASVPQPRPGRRDGRRRRRPDQAASTAQPVPEDPRQPRDPHVQARPVRPGRPGLRCDPGHPTAP